MSDERMKRLRGLSALLRDGVIHGATAVERVHRETARRPFAVLQAIPPLRAPAASVETAHDAVVGLSYASVRAVTGVVAGAVDLAIDLVDHQQGSPAEPADDESIEPVAAPTAGAVSATGPASDGSDRS